MSSFATAGSSAKAATLILPGRRGKHETAMASIARMAGAALYPYTTPGLKEAVNVTGSGVLTFGYFGADFVSTTNTVKITIDGTVVLNDTLSDDASQNGMSQVGSVWFNATQSTSNQQRSVSQGAVIFNTSLKIEVECNNDFCSYAYNYYLT